METDGWALTDTDSKSAFDELVAKLRAKGVVIGDRRSDARLAEIEEVLRWFGDITRAINVWESRWPLNTYARDMDGSQLSETMRKRLAAAEAMSLDEYRELLQRRESIRVAYANAAGSYDAFVSLAATGPAPIGIASTGDPVYVIPSSLFGVPALSLPLLQVDGLPVGLQLLGKNGQDAELFAHAAWIVGAGMSHV